MAISEKELAHLAGEGVVMKFWYADPEKPGMANVTTTPLSGEARELWEDAAFTNGGPLVKIELIWSPKEAEELAKLDAEAEAGEAEAALADFNANGGVTVEQLKKELKL
jgi:hypothetical protein